MDDNFTISQSKTTISPARDYSQKGNRANVEYDRGTGVSEPMSGPEFRSAVERFERKIASGKPIREDFPRGYYLNVRV